MMPWSDDRIRIVHYGGTFENRLLGKKMNSTKYDFASNGKDLSKLEDIREILDDKDIEDSETLTFKNSDFQQSINHYFSSDFDGI